jgi:hypothetical protein
VVEGETAHILFFTVGDRLPVLQAPAPSPPITSTSRRMGQICADDSSASTSRLC